MEAHNAGLTDEVFESAVRRVADVFIQNGIWLQRCGCCGSVETESCIFDSLNVTRDGSNRWSVSANAHSWDGNGIQQSFSLTYTV